MVQEGELAIAPTGQDVDSLAPIDSVAQSAEIEYGILLTRPPEEAETPRRDDSGYGVSYILTGLFILTLIIALRFRDNMKHFVAMVHDMINTRIRQNAFDDTVRETSLVVLLNLLWCGSAGIIGYCVISNGNLGAGIGNAADGMLWGMLYAAAYTVFLLASYLSVGWVFSDLQHAQLWVKGYAASQALMSPAFFITALLALCCPGETQIIGIFSLGVFIAGKMAFIFKGYRIFFNQFSSWVLFLCYLCSLEIVPLIIIYRIAILLG